MYKYTEVAVYTKKCKYNLNMQNFINNYFYVQQVCAKGII